MNIIINTSILFSVFHAMPMMLTSRIVVGRTCVGEHAVRVLTGLPLLLTSQIGTVTTKQQQFYEYH